MNKKKYNKFLQHNIMRHYLVPKDDDIYTDEILRVIAKYTKWLKANGLKAKPDGFPTTFKKAKTKPKGRNPEIIRRNDKILKEYYKLTEKKGLKAKVARDILSKKYNLKPSSIQTICKRG